MEPLLKSIIVVLLPPLGVAVHEGLTGHLVINLALTVLGYVPGIVHGLWRVLRKDQ
jgi:uncharacterized membrane protein YqaE (UPF0057 family)